MASEAELVDCSRVLERFQREARTVAQLDHPGIVPIPSASTSDRSILVMPLVRGTDLRARVKGRGLLLGDTLETTEQVALALDYSHAQGVIHRDVESGYILVAKGRRSLRVLVTGFGLARDIRAIHSNSAERCTLTGGKPLVLILEQMVQG